MLGSDIELFLKNMSYFWTRPNGLQRFDFLTSRANNQNRAVFELFLPPAQVPTRLILEIIVQN